MSKLWPTSDEVARAIIAACKTTGADPLDTASGVGVQKLHGVERTHARIYAALALRELFVSQAPGGPGNVSFSRMVGGNKNLLTVFDNQKRHSGVYWFDDREFEQVKAAVFKKVDLKALVPVGGPLNPRKVVVPASQCLDMTSSLMGDPPLARSALAEYRERAHNRQIEEDY